MYECIRNIYKENEREKKNINGQKLLLSALLDKATARMIEWKA